MLGSTELGKSISKSDNSNSMQQLKDALNNKPKILTIKIEKSEKGNLQVDNLMGRLKQEVSKTSENLNKLNAQKRPAQYPEFANTKALRIVGEELTLEARKNFDELIKETSKYSSLGFLPEQQIKDLKEFISTHRIFVAPKQDHDRSRIEFEIKKENIISGWEKKYGQEWPTYDANVYADGKISARKGKPVSRHHFFPVRLLVLKDTPEVDKALKSGKLDPKKIQNFADYEVNASWNMIPSKCPLEHTEGIHGNNSWFTKTFGPIKEDYHYDKIENNDNEHWNSRVPKEFQAVEIPLYVQQFDFFLEKLEQRTEMKIPQVQREAALEALVKYAKEFPSNTDFKSIDYTKQATYLSELAKLISNKKHGLIVNWEKETGQKWPLGPTGYPAKPAFVIPPYYKANQPQWWMIHPDKFQKRRPKKGKHYQLNAEKTQNFSGSLKHA